MERTFQRILRPSERSTADKNDNKGSDRPDLNAPPFPTGQTDCFMLTERFKEIPMVLTLPSVVKIIGVVLRR